MKFIANTLDDTKKIAENLAQNTLNGDVITLSGDLGAGKTAFSKFFINSLLKEETEVTSPTFNLVHPYEAEEFVIHHFDLYRIKCESELENIGFFDALDDGVCLIEWPDVANNYLPKNIIAITINSSKNGAREFNINATEQYKQKLKG